MNPGRNSSNSRCERQEETSGLRQCLEEGAARASRLKPGSPKRERDGRRSHKGARRKEKETSIHISLCAPPARRPMSASARAARNLCRAIRAELISVTTAAGQIGCNAGLPGESRPSPCPSTHNRKRYVVRVPNAPRPSPLLLLLTPPSSPSPSDVPVLPGRPSFF